MTLVGCALRRVGKAARSIDSNRIKGNRALSRNWSNIDDSTKQGRSEQRRLNKGKLRLSLAFNCNYAYRMRHEQL
jgi:hypothetical protein